MTTEIHVLDHALQRFAPEPGAVYSIDTAAHLSGVPRHWILVYCRHHFVAPLVDPAYGGLYFDDAMIRLLQRIEYLRAECQINFAGIQIILDLVQEVERLRERAYE